MRSNLAKGGRRASLATFSFFRSLAGPHWQCGRVFSQLRASRFTPSRFTNSFWYSPRAPALLGALSIAGLLLVAGCGTTSQPVLQRFQYVSPQMGTTFRITLYATNATFADAAAEAAFNRVSELEDILSDYMADSELMRLSHTRSGEPVAVSDELLFILQRGSEISALTGGAFDLTSGPLTRLWRFSRKRGTLPSETELAVARAAVDWRHLQLSTNTQTATLAVDGMRLDAGGMAKGYAADEALRVLEEHGTPRALIAAGGDIRAGQPPPGTEGWRVTIAGTGQAGSQVSGWVGSSVGAGGDSRYGGSGIGLTLASPAGPVRDQPAPQTLLVRNAAISTSGDTEQFVEIEGVRYSHIVSPFTGLGLTNRIQATVIAPNATTSDALATACCILGPEKAIELADSLPKVAVVLVTREGAETRIWKSRRAP